MSTCLRASYLKWNALLSIQSKVKYYKKKHSFSKWMTNEILQSINQKNRLYAIDMYMFYMVSITQHMYIFFCFLCFIYGFVLFYLMSK